MDKEARAEQRGRESAYIEMAESVDDVDRAIDNIYSSNDLSQVAEGVAHLRSRFLHRFEQAGFVPFAIVGDTFNPHLHEAISSEPGYGPDNTISRVHRRGWMRREDGQVIRAAMVTVCKGTPEQPVAEPEPSLDASGPSCRYGTPGCDGTECPSCKLAGSIGGGR